MSREGFNSLSLVSLNIERDLHLQKIAEFFANRTFDVACIQELRRDDIPVLEEALRAECHFAQMMRHKGHDEGLGIFTRRGLVDSAGTKYYAGADKQTLDFDRTSAKRKVETQSYALIWAKVVKSGVHYTIASTHFTWTPDGQVNEYQRLHLPLLLAALSPLNEFVLCGDFNAPRGGPIFSKLANHFKDNVPPRYKTSLDVCLHRAGYLERMVDGIFSTPGYKVTDVEMVSGLSDHCALTAKVTAA